MRSVVLIALYGDLVPSSLVEMFRRFSRTASHRRRYSLVQYFCVCELSFVLCLSLCYAIVCMLFCCYCVVLLLCCSVIICVILCIDRVYCTTATGC